MYWYKVAAEWLTKRKQHGIRWHFQNCLRWMVYRLHLPGYFEYNQLSMLCSVGRPHRSAGVLLHVPTYKPCI